MQLQELEGAAQAAKKGRWAAEAEGTMGDHVRNIDWAPDISKAFVDQFHGKPIQGALNRSNSDDPSEARLVAVIEQVRDGSTVRAFLLPDFQYVTLMMSGLKSPLIRLGEGGKVVEAEPFADEAKFFSEVRLLQRDVDVVLHST